MRDATLKQKRDKRIVKRYRELCALKKYRVDYIMKHYLEPEFFLKPKTLYGIISNYEDIED
ncbi:MAG: hypothetical protein R2800_09925 [Flavipsychrobacter sp.]